MQRTQNAEVALDLTQDVFIMAYRNWENTATKTVEDTLSVLLALADDELRQYSARRGRFERES